MQQASVSQKTGGGAQLLFLGAPGAGKGTQCKRLAKALHLPHLSSGDLLREAVKTGTVAGIRAKSFMDTGKLVPDDVLIAMFKDKLSSPECANGFILDGFPRNISQAESLDGLLKDLHKELSAVINVQVEDALLLERITGRRVCENKDCATPYHVKFARPKQENKCDACGSALMTRADDKAELVEQRLNTYKQQTQPLIGYYKQRHVLHSVDGNGEPESIFAAIMKVVPNDSHAS